MRLIRQTVIASRDGYAWGGSDVIAWEKFHHGSRIAKSSDVSSSGLRAYRSSEDAYVQLLGRICEELGGEYLLVASPVLREPPPSFLSEFRNGSSVDVELAGRMARYMLRGEVGFACNFMLPGRELRIAFGDAHSLLVEGAERRVSAVIEMLPPSLFVADQLDLEDDFIPVPADDVFWAAVMRDAARSGRPAWIQERWADGKYGERWFLADSSAVPEVRASVYGNSAICAGVVGMPMEEIRLDELFDDVTASSADDLDVFVLSGSPGGGPEVGALPLCGQLVKSGNIPLTEPVRILYPGKFRIAGMLEPGERLREAVVPDAAGDLWARWLGIANGDW